MAENLALSHLLGKIVGSVRENLPGTVSAAFDVFVNPATFRKLRDANPAAFSEHDGEPVLSISLGDYELLVFDEEVDE